MVNGKYFLLLSIILISGCVSTPSTDHKTQWIKHTDPISNAFSIDYPSDWTKTIQVTNPDPHVTFESPEGLTVGIIITPAFDNIDATFQLLISDKQIEMQSDSTLADISAKLAYLIVDDSGSIKRRYIKLAQKDDAFILFDYIANEDIYEDGLVFANKMESSLVLE